MSLTSAATHISRAESAAHSAKIAGDGDVDRAIRKLVEANDELRAGMKDLLSEIRAIERR